MTSPDSERSGTPEPATPATLPRPGTRRLFDVAPYRPEPEPGRTPTGMRTLIVGVDASPAGRRALRWAALTARGTGARVAAVHVVPRTTLWVLAALQVDTTPILRALRRKLESSWTQDLRDCGVEYWTRFLAGSPARELVRIAERFDSSLIVVGVPHRGGAHDRWLAGRARRLVYHTCRPVALVPYAQRSFERP